MEKDHSEITEDAKERKMMYVKEAAQIMGISTDKLYSLIRTEPGRSEFPFTKIGSKIIIPRDRLYEYLGIRPDETVEFEIPKTKKTDLIDQFMSDRRKSRVKQALHQLVDAIFE